MYNVFIFYVLNLLICTFLYTNKSNGNGINLDNINKIDSIDIGTVKGELKTFSAPTGAAISDARFTVKVRNANTAWQSLPVYAFFVQYVYNWAQTAEPQFVN